ncbi:iroquois-class homeodomain protein IRX-6 [Struthio camelus]|uniref:iroquois-class homeodomain protein IRX-6 n=1 Tax=Struthio camelus TaxID=8801 RepID=UPI003603DABB
MSFSQFGYPYSTTSQFLVPASPGATCCEAAPAASPGPAAAAAPLCCPPYENRLLAATRSELNAALGMYGAPYAAAQGYAGCLPYGADPAALYPSLNPQYDVKDGTGPLPSGIAQPAAYYSYDHSLGQYQYDRYGTVDFSGSARRKNATRETTSTLKTWLYEHRKNPYPTKGEKIMLAIITKMTLTQVSTWFANARRRLKKENKMTWSPKNKAGEERKEGNKREEEEYGAESEGREPASCREAAELRLSDLDDLEEEEEEEAAAAAGKGRRSPAQESGLAEARSGDCSLAPPGPFRAFPAGPPPPYAPAEKPRIWSPARTAGAEGPPAALSPRPARAQPCHLAAAAQGCGRSARGGPGGGELPERRRQKLRTASRPVLRRGDQDKRVGDRGRSAALRGAGPPPREAPRRRQRSLALSSDGEVWGGQASEMQIIPPAQDSPAICHADKICIANLSKYNLRESYSEYCFD